MNKDKCANCDREINDNIKTKDGCVWCDEKYHKSPKTIAINKLQEIKNEKIKPTGKHYKSFISLIWNSPISLFVKIKITWRIFLKRLRGKLNG